MKECCGKVLYGEVLRTGVVEKCCEGVVKWCRDVVWGSVDREVWWGSAAGTCCEEVLWRSVGKECCGEVL